MEAGGSRVFGRFRRVGDPSDQRGIAFRGGGIFGLFREIGASSDHRRAQYPPCVDGFPPSDGTIDGEREGEGDCGGPSDP